MVQHVLRKSRSYQVGLADRRTKSTALSELTSALLTSCILQTATGQEQWLVISQGSRHSELNEGVGENGYIICSERTLVGDQMNLQSSIKKKFLLLIMVTYSAGSLLALP